MDNIKATLCVSVQDSLPTSVRSWRDIDTTADPQWAQPWEFLRPFFREAGYDLYRAGINGKLSTPNTTTPPALDSFGLYGDRSKLRTHFIPVSQVFPARDTMDRDVVIKLISKGKEGENERQILQMLNSEPLQCDPANSTVPVIEFLEYQEYCFAVMPYCDGCDERPFLHASECLDFAEQVLEGISFLHTHRIAHLDISTENILVNHHGLLTQTFILQGQHEPPLKIWPPQEWRSTFPVRYLFMDFGYSIRFNEDVRLGKCTALPFPQGREHRAPEVRGTQAFNPFAADVYQTARIFYGWFPDLVDDVPDLLKLLQDMSSYNPSRRITATEALARLRTLRSTIPDEKLKDLRERELLIFPLVPRSHLVMFRDILETGKWSLACQFAWALLQIWLFKTTGNEKTD
ncbi:hypothetical protein SCP_0509910 [Sparassis crispa]|uniref:Protein kinase domain-containing protein n=1 Tax=Sparassis crispa TaxID=139825 RepID=A0A401GP01_9APHY|nr:hypothetical protein SCP_0509910 [Sparassis crispa]GBE83932.1 hypothetical protein SCP_0509910 [Sparassis crispa]